LFDREELVLAVDAILKAQYKEKYKDEQVFVVPFMVLSGIQNGFTYKKHDKEIWKRFDNIGKFVFRYDAEGEPSMQQIIPYIIIKHSTENKYYVGERIAGEPRLLGQLSLGFGGHINPCDGPTEVLFKALFRELNEEVFIGNITSSAKFIGYLRSLNGDTNDHTGCIFVVETDSADIKEVQSLKGQWMTAKELEDNYFKFEDWSRHLIDHLVEKKYF
jgi:predicted NUDIX family phosphoesterase